MWAFGYSPESAEQLWNCVPLDADIVVAHTPPKYHLDERKDRRSVGCEGLRHTLWRVRPRLAICGHIHEGRGVETIRWDISQSNGTYKEAAVESWTDPGQGNKKLSLVDLSRRGSNSLDNDGSPGDRLPKKRLSMMEKLAINPTKSSTAISSIGTPPVSISSSQPILVATRGQGGIPPSPRCDLLALAGRMGRKETCIVNAAMMASSYPHGDGGKIFNKPIVVDIDLPVWEDHCE